FGGLATPFPDGTKIPYGSVPAINDAGQVAFKAAVQDSTVVDSRLFLATGSTMELCAKPGDPAPGFGDPYGVFGDPALNNRGEIPFLATLIPASGPIGAAWFRGLPGDLHKVITFHEPLAGGEIYEIAFSRNPFRPLDDCGNLALWIRVQYPDL